MQLATRSSPWKNDIRSHNQDISNLLWDTKMHYRLHKTSPLHPIQSKLNPVTPSHFISLRTIFMLAIAVRGAVLLLHIRENTDSNCGSETDYPEEFELFLRWPSPSGVQCFYSIFERIRIQIVARKPTILRNFVVLWIPLRKFRDKYLKFGHIRFLPLLYISLFITHPITQSYGDRNYWDIYK
jgi:hypothetical protein